MPSHHATIGVLALQGDFAAHCRTIENLGCTAVQVRSPAQLEPLAGLIMPGGESTALLKLMAAVDFEPALKKFHNAGKPIFGTCAGLILIASDVTNPHQHSLGLLDITVERNSYGRQIDSFEATGTLTLPNSHHRSLEMVFIRAPRIVRVGPDVNVDARYQDEPVLVSAGNVMGATFHPEMTSDSTVHQRFVSLCRSN